MAEDLRYSDPASTRGVAVSKARPLPVHEFRLINAIEQIYGDYGHRAEIKPKGLRKFGRNEAVGTSAATVMTLPDSINSETLSSSNAITVMSSSSGSDTQNLTLLEGHTSSSADLTFVANTTVTALTGQTDANLPVALTRGTRGRLSAPATGTIYFHEGGATTSGVPDDLSTVHMIIPAGEIQTQKASTSISSVDYWIITSITAGVLEKTGAWAQVRVEIKPWQSTYFYPVCEWLAVSDASGTVQLMGADDPAIIVPPNHDVRMVAIANTTGVDVVGGMSGYLALIQ